MTGTRKLTVLFQYNLLYEWTVPNVPDHGVHAKVLGDLVGMFLLAKDGDDVAGWHDGRFQELCYDTPATFVLASSVSVGASICLCLFVCPLRRKVRVRREA